MEVPKLVIVTKRKLEINVVYRGLQRGPWHEPEPSQCYKVIVPSTEQGWIDCLVAFHGEQEREWLEILAAINGPWNYYEIQTD